MKTWIAKIKDSGPWIVFFEIFVIAQLLLIFVFNLTHLKYEAGFDSSAAMAQAMEIWNQKSIFLKHWDYQSTLGLDSVIIPASIFYGITHNIFLAYGIADCLGVLLYIYIFRDVFKMLQLPKLVRMIVYVLLLTPYSLEPLGYMPMMFTLLNGTHKGEEISISNEYTSSQVQNQKYHKGDTVLLSGSRENPGKSIRSIKRDGYLALLAGGLFFLLICITGKQGFYTIISLILNTIIFAFGFQAFMKGENILNICNVIAFLFSITTLICLNGIHRKTWASVISTICVLFLIMALFEFSIQFFGDLDYSNLEYLGSMSNSADIFWTDIMLTGLGAIMDVAVTISAATGEIVRKNPDVSLRKLIHSGREIGYDIMGTMINVLLFVLASGMIPMFILKMNNEIRFITIIRYHIPYDICRFLIESIGIVLAIPVSVFISSIIMKLPFLKRSDKK